MMIWKGTLTNLERQLGDLTSVQKCDYRILVPTVYPQQSRNTLYTYTLDKIEFVPFQSLN
jgi:hypothetical protein